MYVHAYCMRKVNKTLSLRLDVVEKLEEQENQSEYVQELLEESFDG